MHKRYVRYGTADPAHQVVMGKNGVEELPVLAQVTAFRVGPIRRGPTIKSLVNGPSHGRGGGLACLRPLR